MLVFCLYGRKMSKRKVEIFLDAQENAISQRISQNETRIPIQDINPNTLNTTIRNSSMLAKKQNRNVYLEEENVSATTSKETSNQQVKTTVSTQARRVILSHLELINKTETMSNNHKPRSKLEEVIQSHINY